MSNKFEDMQRKTNDEIIEFETTSQKDGEVTKFEADASSYQPLHFGIEDDEQDKNAKPKTAEEDFKFEEPLKENITEKPYNFNKEDEKEILEVEDTLVVEDMAEAKEKLEPKETIENEEFVTTSALQGEMQDDGKPQKESKLKRRKSSPPREKQAVTLDSPGFSEKTFQVFSKLSLPILLLLTLGVCLQQFFFLRDFWIAEEVRLADAYMNLLVSKDFFISTLNGSPFAQIGPLYFAFLWLLDLIPQISTEQVFFVSTIIFTTLYIMVTWLMARAMGFGKQIAFASGLIMLSSYSFLALSNYVQTDIIYATFINFSLLLFYLGWRKQNGFFLLSFAFIFMAMAVLIKGPFAFILLLLTAILFLAWSGNFRRLNSGDGVLGFMFFLIIVFTWGVYLYLTNEFDYLKEVIQTQILNPYKIESVQEPYFYGIVFALISLPWIFLLLFINWLKVLTGIGQVFKGRKTETKSSWLICVILSGLAILTLQNEKIAINLLPILPALAILFAKALLNLSPGRSKLFFSLLALILLLTGGLALAIEFQAYILPYIPVNPYIPREFPTHLNTIIGNTQYGLSIMGGILVLFALILLKFTKRSFAGGSLLVFSLAIVLCTQPFSLLISPQLNAILSPKNQSQLLAEYNSQGYAVASHKINSSIYTYYFNMAKNPHDYPRASIPNFNKHEDFIAFLGSNPKVVLATPTKDFEQLPNREYARVVHKSWLAEQEISFSLWEAPKQEVIEEVAPTVDSEIKEEIAPAIDSETMEETPLPVTPEAIEGTTPLTTPTEDNLENPAEAPAETPLEQPAETTPIEQSPEIPAPASESTEAPLIENDDNLTQEATSIEEAGASEDNTGSTEVTEQEQVAPSNNVEEAPLPNAQSAPMEKNTGQNQGEQNPVQTNNEVNPEADPTNTAKETSPPQDEQKNPTPAE